MFTRRVYLEQWKRVSVYVEQWKRKINDHRAPRP
jgi:hypothetical protein